MLGISGGKPQSAQSSLRKSTTHFRTRCRSLTICHESADASPPMWTSSQNSCVSSPLLTVLYNKDQYQALSNRQFGDRPEFGSAEWLWRIGTHLPCLFKVYREDHVSVLPHGCIA